MEKGVIQDKIAIPDRLGAAYLEYMSAKQVYGRGCNPGEIWHTGSTRSSVMGKHERKTSLWKMV